MSTHYCQGFYHGPDTSQTDQQIRFLLAKFDHLAEIPVKTSCPLAHNFNANPATKTKEYFGYYAYLIVPDIEVTLSKKSNSLL